jgi:8-oxo-dGTP diphosphatase
MAGQDRVPAPEEPERPKRRRRRRRRTSGGKDAASGSGGRAAATGTAARAAKDQPEQPKSRRRRGRATKGAARKPAARKPTAKAKPKPKPKKLPTQREVSAGGVVYRRADGSIEVVLASRRTRRGDLAWGLAKGGIERGESREEAALREVREGARPWGAPAGAKGPHGPPLREVREETGLDATIEADLGDTRYIYVWEDVRIRKRVHFFLMRHTGGDVDDRDDEMEEVRWFPLERALKRAAYRGERDVLARAAELLR